MHLKPSHVHRHQSRPAKKGLGDFVAAAIKPAVIAIEATTGKDFSNCTGCAGRIAGLNSVGAVIADAGRSIITTITGKETE